MAWRLARSLQVLTAEVRQLHPGTTVWTIGDAAHRASASDHNENPAGVVCASDTLGDRGLDLGWYAARVVASRHPALKYVIWNRRIWSKTRADEGWRPYGGSNPHTGHVHVSVGVGPDGRSTGPYDDTSPWGLTQKEEDDMQLDDPVKIPKWMVDKWPDEGLKDGTISVNTALGSGYGHARSGKDETYRQTPILKAILAAVAGEDVADAAARASRDAVRAEFAALGPALAAQLADVPAERVEAALRNVLGSLDES